MSDSIPMVSKTAPSPSDRDLRGHCGCFKTASELRFYPKNGATVTWFLLFFFELVGFTVLPCFTTSFFFFLATVSHRKVQIICNLPRHGDSVLHSVSHNGWELKTSQADQLQHILLGMVVMLPTHKGHVQRMMATRK